jgi:hypothetical protein
MAKRRECNKLIHLSVSKKIAIRTDYMIDNLHKTS